jgi:hypothetical protein
MLSGMAPIDKKHRAEQRMRALLDNAGLPDPDEVQYGQSSISLLWHDRKVAVVVDVSEFDEIDGNEGYRPDGIAA